MKNFEEDVYFALNPDVEEAVFNGTFSSGAEHFKKAGIDEGRISTIEEFIENQSLLIKELRLKLTKSEESINALREKNETLSTDFSNELTAIKSTISWRITEPLRGFYKAIKKTKLSIKSLVLVIRQYGFLKIVRFLPKILFKKNAYWRAVNALKNASHKCSGHIDWVGDRSVRVVDIESSQFRLSRDVAVHAHIYYLNLADEIVGYLNNIPVPFNLYLTITSASNEKELLGKFKKLQYLKKINIKVVENRGRDIAPMLVSLGKELSSHDIVLHIHTKKSPHNSWMLGGWRRYLMEMLLGSPQRVLGILEEFVKDPRLGILFPTPYFPVRAFMAHVTNANDQNMKFLIQRYGKSEVELKNIDSQFFPAGDMFWFRGEAIRSFIDMGLSIDHFEAESGQTNATMAHAIERMFPYFAQERGLLSKNYYVDSFENQNCSAHKLYLLEELISNGAINNIVVLFDHNFGGGTNTYSKELVAKNLHAGFNFIRVYYFDCRWLLEWHGSGDGLHFYSESLESVFNILDVKQVVKIVVNSLYGAPEYKDLIHRIIALKNKNHLNLEIKIHDFLTVCPSPHLLDSNGSYCGVPSKAEDCNKCINGLDEWYPAWVQAEDRVKKIEEWRAPFRNLFEAADTVSTFDESSYEILSKAYKLNKSHIKVIPHEATHINFSEKIDLNGPLKIGVLGTLTKAKGIEKIRELAEYIDKNNLPAKIIVIGAADLRNTRVLSIHGAYEVKDLPILIKQNRINVIFCSSIIPETFGYTLSEAMALELPILCFDIGAQAKRVKPYKNGKVIDLMSSPERTHDSLKQLLSDSIKRK